MITAKEAELIAALEPEAESEGIEIVTVEVVGAKRAPIIRVLIDTPQGVSFDELASAQVWINEIMDALDPFPGAYTLEVSSPGIDRPLRTLAHFKAALGSKVQVTTREHIDGRAKWRGELTSIEGAENPDAQLSDISICITTSDDTYVIALDQIKRATLLGVVDFNA